jgi:predicted HTH domain antitoxin
METVQINLPKQAHIEDFEVKMLVAGGLYEKGRLSAGEAAAVAGLSKLAFLEILAIYGFSILGYTVSELEEDMEGFEVWKKS